MRYLKQKSRNSEKKKWQTTYYYKTVGKNVNISNKYFKMVHHKYYKYLTFKTQTEKQCYKPEGGRDREPSTEYNTWFHNKWFFSLFHPDFRGKKKHLLQ